MCGKDLSLITRVVTHPGTSDTGRFLHLDNVFLLNTTTTPNQATKDILTPYRTAFIS